MLFEDVLKKYAPKDRFPNLSPKHPYYEAMREGFNLGKKYGNKREPKLAQFIKNLKFRIGMYFNRNTSMNVEISKEKK